MATIGFSITGSLPPAALPEVLRRCEELGFDEIWVSETFYGGGALATASIALATTRLTVGFGVLSTAVRHPAVLAMEAATLSGIYPGRVRLGLGLGMEVRLQEMAIDDAAEKKQLPADVDALRRLLAGEPVRFGPGPEVRLEHVPEKAPQLVLAGMGRLGLKQAAQLGDGVLLSWMSGPAYVAWAREHIARHSGGVPRWVGANTMLAAGTDRNAVRREARAVLGQSLGRIPAPMIEPMGILPGIAEYRGKPGGVPPEKISDEWLDALLVAGDEGDCRAAMRRLVGAGLDTLVLNPIPAARALDMLSQLTRGTLDAARAGA